MFNQISTLWTKANIFLMENGFVASAIDGSDKVKKVINQVMELFPWIGVIFAVWGGMRIILALRNDGNPEAINGGARDLIVGIALILFKTLFGSTIVGFF
ncbi:hypothetical protein LIZ85_00570 [[Eubacterium] rectale]|jgi:hypothetical protein|uniref:hypothetical protein n=2 Tax=Agathobacter rectalis TaxID=39491 RepID=UPI0027D28E85|nr:hypothetical protein [Agathobacter rectalis]MCB7108361.1 hypothetical protein [Agathobacter rectalis]MCG4811760.1 hypothetical protein [Agathobacter rectalis]